MQISSQRSQYLEEDWDNEACGWEYASAYETLWTIYAILEDVQVRGFKARKSYQHRGNRRARN